MNTETAAQREQYRTERDTLGEVKVPVDRLYGAQTQRAVDNFKIGNLRLQPLFLKSLAAIKGVCAEVNRELGQLTPEVAEAICQAAEAIVAGGYEDQFPVSVYQTGSGTSTNMNMNEVLATLASRSLGWSVHPNDQVNRSQSSNDVIPTAIHVSAYWALSSTLLPSLDRLQKIISRKARLVDHVVKTGRTHLMDAVPIRMSQELSGWEWQIASAADRLRARMPALARLAIGGTAVGTGLNAPQGFGSKVAAKLGKKLGYPFEASENPFGAISSQDVVVDLSGSLRSLAGAMFKIANDLRLMNSGPVSGFGEITLAALQPGSSIMPAKVNPVAPEAVAMACVQVVGNDAAIAIAGQSGSFQLNTMLPLVAYNLLDSIQLLAASATFLGEGAIQDFLVNEERIAASLGRNPILVTALTPVLGYERAAEIAKRARSEGRNIREVTLEMTNLSREFLDQLLDPITLTGSSPQ